MVEVKLRSGTLDDADAICDVHRASIMGLGRPAYSADECKSWASDLTPALYAEAMTKGGEKFFVAETEAGLCGFCSFKGDEIIGLYVLPSASRKGLGGRLLAQAESAIAATGADRIGLTAALSALAFYKAMGYAAIRKREWETRGGVVIEVCDMEKRL